MDFARAYDPIRALGGSWRLIGKAPLALLSGGIVLAFTDGGGGFGFDLEGHHFQAAELLVLIGIFGCVGLVFLLINAWISLGLGNVVEKTIVHGRADFGDLFDARGRFFEMVLGHLLVILICLGAALPFLLIVLGGVAAHEGLGVNEAVAVIVALVALLAYLPFYLYVVLGISLWRQAIAIEGLGPTAAVRRSWDLVRGHRLRLLLYWIVLSIFAVLGFCLCCIGVLFTSAQASVAQYESYVALTKPETYARSWMAGAPFTPPDLRATVP